MAAYPPNGQICRRKTAILDDILQDTAVALNKKPTKPQGGGSTPLAEEPDEMESTDSGGKRRSSPDPSAPIYGELIVLGTNGSLPCSAISPKMGDRFVLRKQHKATGVSPITRDPTDLDSLARKSTHTVTMSKSTSKSHVTEYGHDPRTDLFQIGRSADSAIDFVVVETVTNPDGTKQFKANSTVSRYACRIQCERKPPYSARLYAAAFDTRGRIQLSVNAPIWMLPTREHDGLTTNGVAFMRPTGSFESGVHPGEWREVTVMGNVCKLRPQRSARIPGDMMPEETNILTDGCLIDLCGLTLIWRTAIGLEQGVSQTIMREHRRALNEMYPQCPVNLHTLHFRGNSAASTFTTISTDLDEASALSAASREPWIYIACGHVYSYHSWKASADEDNSQRTCPLCRKIGPYVKLELGQQRAFFIDNGALTHAFVPCGHVTTERSTMYWKSVQIPHLASEWTARCPFCSTPLSREKPAVKLLFN